LILFSLIIAINSINVINCFIMFIKVVANSIKGPKINFNLQQKINVINFFKKILLHFIHTPPPLSQIKIQKKMYESNIFQYNLINFAKYVVYLYSLCYYAKLFKNFLWVKISVYI